MSERRRPLSGTIKRVLIGIGAGLAVITGCAVLFFEDPATSAFFPPCPFYWLSGFWCPGCGSGRALHALLHGDILRALDLNVLMVVSLPLLGYAGISRLSVLAGARSFPRIFAGPFWGWFVFCLVTIYWVVRNIPVYPFTFLAP